MSCNAARARRTITSTCNMGWKKFINQNVVPMGATSWHIKFMATLCTFSGMADFIACNAVCARRPNLSYQHGLDKMILPTCSTHGGYRLVALNISYSFYNFF